jgi:hypothetical protein
VVLYVGVCVQNVFTIPNFMMWALASRLCGELRLEARTKFKTNLGGLTCGYVCQNIVYNFNFMNGLGKLVFSRF